MGHGLVALTRGFFLAACVMTAPAGATTYLYVGNAASNEIVVHALDPNTGDLTVIEKQVVPGITKAGGSIPMAVSPTRKQTPSSTRRVIARRTSSANASFRSASGAGTIGPPGPTVGQVPRESQEEKQCVARSERPA